jgi:hypothetical protein
MKRPGAGELIARKRWFNLFLMFGLMALAVNGTVLRAANGAGGSMQETQPSNVGTPEVTAIDPPGATRGSTVLLKVTGRSFGKGAKISFSNPDIRVMETNDLSPTELTARIQVAPKAAIGATSLYVTNPNYRQAEMPFQVVDSGTPKPPPTTAGGTTPAGELRFDVIHIKGKNILTPNKIKGVLTWSKGKLRLEENGQEVFSLTPGEIKEIDKNLLLGVSANSFHVMLRSGTKYDFWAASLKPSETNSMADALKHAVH